MKHGCSRHSVWLQWHVCIVGSAMFVRTAGSAKTAINAEVRWRDFSISLAANIFFTVLGYIRSHFFWSLGTSIGNFDEPLNHWQAIWPVDNIPMLHSWSASELQECKGSHGSLMAHLYQCRSSVPRQRTLSWLFSWKTPTHCRVKSVDLVGEVLRKTAALAHNVDIEAARSCRSLGLEVWLVWHCLIRVRHWRHCLWYLAWSQWGIAITFSEQLGRTWQRSCLAADPSWKCYRSPGPIQGKTQCSESFVKAEIPAIESSSLWAKVTASWRQRS